MTLSEPRSYWPIVDFKVRMPPSRSSCGKDEFGLLLA
jgi:hypothetical protein